MKRADAVAVAKELLDSCVGLDGCSLELTPPSSPDAGYQITIRGMLGEETRKCIGEIAARHLFSCQVGSMWRTRRSIGKEPDTLIIYRAKTSVRT